MNTISILFPLSLVLITIVSLLVTSTNGISLSNKFNKKILTSILAAGLTITSPLTVNNLNTNSNIVSISTSSAAIAPLADVGVKEFLVKDGKQWLRLSLPSRGIDKTIQESIELVKLRLEQVGFSAPAAFSKAAVDASTSEQLIKSNRDQLAKLSTNPTLTNTIIDDELLPTLSRLLQVMKDKDVVNTLKLQDEAADQMYKVRKLQFQTNKLNYEIPSEYSSLSTLQGRATVEMIIEKGKGRNFRLNDGKTLVPSITFLMEVDGYHAPITSGNFIDLINKKVYDNMKLQKVEEQVIQFGKPSSGGDNYIDPVTNEVRTIPLEIFYRNDDSPVYSATSDDDVRATEAMALPFQATGAIGMARYNDDIDSASSQVFFLKFNQALNPPGRNTLDGFFTCFGYISTNTEYLDQVMLDDKIVSMKVIDGLDNFNQK